jgi:protein-arginine kinase activator protein McsA
MSMEEFNKLIEKFFQSPDDWMKNQDNTWTSQVKVYYYTIDPNGNVTSIKESTPQQNKGDISITDAIKNLESQLQRAVSQEDYLKAAELRDKLISLKENQLEIENQVKELDRQLQVAIDEQDYKKAHEIKEKKKEIVKGLSS